MPELIKQYAEKFNENFPLFALMGLDDEEIEAILQDCLDKGTHYQPPDLEEKSLY